MKAFAEEFLELSTDLLLIGRLDGFYHKSSARLKELLGWDELDLSSRPLWEFFHPEDQDSVKASLAELLTSEKVLGFECRILTKSGDYRWTSWNGKISRQDPSLFLAIGKDIHAQKEWDAFYKLFFESSSVGFNLCSMDGTWIESNQAFLKMIGYSKQEVDGGLTYWQLTPNKYEEMETIQLKMLLDKGIYGPYEKEFIRKDGKLIPVRLNGFIIERDGQPFIWSIIEDISVEKKFKQEVEAKTLLFEAIVENIPAVLFLKDIKDNFKITFWNKAAEKFSHFPRDQAIGKTSHDMWPQEVADQYLADDQRVVNAGNVVDIKEEPALNSNGDTLYLHTRKVPIKVSKDPDAKPELLLCISEDITERKKLETELRGAIEMRDEFLSIASHELRTPLSSLALQLELLKRFLSQVTFTPSDNTEKILMLAKKANTSCDQLGELLNELLDITRIRAGKFVLSKVKMDLKHAVEEIAAQMSEEIKKSGSPLILENLESVWGIWDPKRIGQVISNLFSNAIKYGEGKAIHVSIGTDQLGKKAILKVKDEGMGIPEELQESIFRRFERCVSGEKISGLGLGLYIVEQILRSHGGSIRVESEVKKGSLFIVELPL